MIQNIAQTIYKVLASKKFFYAIVALLIIQAVWLALTVQYPQAFDESYHFGIIQVYSHQWLPFIPTEPAGASGFGDITRYDSYMYHYLMSFPYRLFAVFVHDLPAQVIFMRFINIGLFVGGVIFFRRLLARFNISAALIHVALLLFVIVPVVPSLAATINYDNMIFLFVPILAGFALSCATSIIKNKTLPASSFIWFIAIGCIGSLTKYAFAPIFIGAIVYLFALWIFSHKKSQILKSIISSFKTIKRSTQIVLIVALVISGGLFLGRYGGNLVTYHSFAPDCADLNPLSECLNYGPWARNYYLDQQVHLTNPPYDPAIAIYPFSWIKDMIYRLYFTINYDFVEYSPLPIPYITAWIIGGIGTILSLVFWRKILRVDKRLLLLISMMVIYVGGLFYVNFTEFLHYRTIVAVNGRYSVIILPILFVLIGLAYRRLFQLLFKKRATTFLNIFAVIVLLLALQGGGAATYLLRSQPIWYWQYQPLDDFNTSVKNAIAPFVVQNDIRI
ncbi:MAG: hypothetical protein JWN26_188 [Candidatus Saccharibacteria bacterium]|nr:hypothetical protein [Candidatus Saccharibacteria bacterium]